ncbi:MAG: hypothetical protein ACREKI_02055 [Gemmatimonadota bacterium]
MGAMMMMHGMGAAQGEMMGPMMRVGVFQPAHLLERKDVLGLSADQVKRLEPLQAASAKADEEAHAAVKTHHEQLAQAMAAARPNAQEARRHFEAAHAAMGRVHWAKMDAAIQAKAALTDVQRARAEGWADAAGSRRRMGGGMMGSEMMQPGMGMRMRGGMGPGAQGQDCPARP